MPAVPVNDAEGISRLIRALQSAGERDALHALALRAVPAVSVHSARETGCLISALQDAGEREAVHALALRAASHVADPAIQYGDGYHLITALRRADEHEALAALTARIEQASAWRAPSHSDSAEADRQYGTTTPPADWTGYGHEPDGQPSPPWDWFDLA